MRARTRFLFVLAGVLACASPAIAAPPTQAEEAKARFLEGREAVKGGEPERALTLFEASQTLFPAPGTLTNMALVEEQLGRLASAWRHFGEVVSGLPPSDVRAQVAREHLSALETRLPRLRIDRAASAPAGTVIKLDGVEVTGDGLGKDAPVDPGKHVVTASAPGREERRFDAILSEGQRAVLAVEPAPAPAFVPAPLPPPAPTAAPSASSAPVAPPPPVEHASGQRLAGYALLGVGVVSVGLGAVMAGLTLGKKSDVEGCMADPSCPATTGRDAESLGRAYGAVSTVGFLAGAALAVGGVVLVLTSPSSKGRTVGAGLAPLPGGGVAAFSGRF